MSDWRIRKRYGFGAARLRINPDLRRGGAPGLGLWESLALARAERGGLGAGPDLRRLSTLAPALLLTLGVTLVLFALMVQRPPAADLEIVRFDPPAPPPPQRDPEPEPEPIPVPDPVPPPAVRPAPPPPPEVAKPPPPSPAPVKRVVRRTEPRVEPPPKPKVRIDAVRRPPQPAPTPERTRRVARPVQRPSTLVPPPVRIDPVDSKPPPRPIPTARRATPRRPAESPRTPVQVAPVASPESFRPVASTRELASLRATPRRSVPVQSERTGPRPDLAVPASPAPQIPQPRAAPRPSRPRREVPATDSERSDMPAGLAPARFAAAAAPTKTPAVSTRGERARPEPDPTSRSQPDEELAGVPLGALAACVSDREEDRLKLAVMAAVRDRKECSSRAGRYRFLEKKNLNAFLMWVERAPSRAEADRCVELELALECLRGGSRAGMKR